MRSVIFAAIADGFLAQKQSAVLLLFKRDKRSGVPAFSDADIERIIKVIETNKFEKWDREAKGN